MARVMISMPEIFLTDIDKLAFRENRTRSELIREALRIYTNRLKPRDMKIDDRNALLLEALLS